MKNRENLQEKECEKCKWHQQHYTSGNSAYIPVNCGHCRNPKYKKRKPVPCDFWEENISVITQRKESIKEVLRSMQKQLKEISQLLKDDNAFISGCRRRHPLQNYNNPIT